ncbi:Lipid A export ATP-binding/permease protein MsbA [Sinobacterium norvegicum]|uniref:Lipid A export ATP-binding/permease protein MsbA n=1 Tax=Sinobacterium norvegicum TaxID=1641715 RepID=A0ABN8ED95_9GAMM|nr:ABC transporter transmembrane domain-containing protein [Sinobacterium norvegicum]CAH0990426.1 Lipid A export ATP-binding/permease protein MsbA [Sinobacterium norvegicum]
MKADTKQQTTLNVVKSISRYLLPYKKTMLAAGIALIVTAGITLSIGQGLQQLIDLGFATGSRQQLSQSIVFIMILIGLMTIGTFVRFYLVSWLGERVSTDIRKDVFDHVITLHPSYFETNRSGEIMSRLTTDTTLLQSIIGSSLSMALRSALMLVGALILLIATNWQLTLIVFLAAPLVLLPIIVIGKRVRKLSRLSQDTVADVGTRAGEAIEHIKTVQSYSQEQYEQANFASDAEHAFDVAKKRIRQRAILVSVVISLVFSAIATMLWIGGNDVLEGRMTGGELGAFIFYALMMAMSMATISEVYGEVLRAVGAAERLLELLAVENEITAAESGNSPVINNAQIVLNNVTFHYPSRPDTAALNNIDLTITAGQSLALVGASGAGKSTIFELLQRFYDPQHGTITLDGKDIRSFQPQSLRQHMGLVAQQPALFSHDVFYNIRYGKPEATEAEVIAAAKAAYADEFISKLPEGYNSYLGERGVRLSGGQRQRIAIARAILNDPKILLLDEATSALDAESELKVQQALEQLMRNRTTVIIAHRLSTIIHADKIAVIDQGEIVAIGSHQQLLDTSEHYQKLVAIQFNKTAETLD